MIGRAQAAREQLHDAVDGKQPGQELVRAMADAYYRRDGAGARRWWQAIVETHNNRTDDEVSAMSRAKGLL